MSQGVEDRGSLISAPVALRQYCSPDQIFREFRSGNLTAIFAGFGSAFSD